MRLLRLHFAAFNEVVTVEAVPEMPFTATRATQSVHGGRWCFWSEQCDRPVSVWSDAEMQIALSTVAERRAKAHPTGWTVVVMEDGQERRPILLENAVNETTAWLEAMNRFKDVIRVIPPINKA